MKGSLESRLAKLETLIGSDARPELCAVALYADETKAEALVGAEREGKSTNAKTIVFVRRFHPTSRPTQEG